MCQGRSRRLALHEVSAMLGSSEAVRGPLTRVCGFVAIGLVEIDCLNQRGNIVKKWNKEALLRTSVLAGFVAAAAAAAPAVAQQQEEEGAQRDRITVTGSRIVRQDYTSGSPLHTVDGGELAEIGAGTVETFLNALPQIYPGLTRTYNNPVSAGQAFLDVRQLGTARGLVLIDGRRMVPGASNGAVNVSVIPSVMVERVEIVTGGASSTYGADAVSGVVNFITRRNFEGMEFSVQMGQSGRGDGDEQIVNFLVGGAFAEGRGHAVFGGSFNNRSSISQADREFSQSASTCRTTGCVLSGSTNTGAGTFSINAAQAADPTLQAYFTSRGVPSNALFANQRLGFNSDGSLFIAGTGTGATANDRVWLYDGNYPAANNYDPASYFGHNFNPENLILSPFERYNFFTNFSYEINPMVELYGSAFFSQYNSQSELASSPAAFSASLTGASATANIQADARAALLASGMTTLALQRRTVEFGPRVYADRSETWEIVGGLRGAFAGLAGSDWEWDVFASMGRYGVVRENRGFPNSVRIAAALNGCPAGSPLGPVGPLGSPTTCTVFNPFGFGNITQDQINYIEAKGAYDRTAIEQRNVVASLTGSLFEIWAGDVQFAAGMEYRSIDYSFVPNEGTQSGALLGGNSAGPNLGGFDVLEYFGEIRVPLLANLPFVHSLTAEAGYRYSDYSNSGGNTFSTDTYKYGLEWEPVDWLRFRAQRQQAVRAPSVGELFATRSEGYPPVGSIIDPCNFNSPQRTGANATQVQALCAAQNANAGSNTFLSQGAQFRVFGGGNPNLTPETAQSTTYGVVFSAPSRFPSLLQSLVVTVDYFDIEIENVVSAIAGTTSLSRCYDPAFNPTFSINNQFCNNVSRDPSTGFVTSAGNNGFLSQQNANLAFLFTSGVDIGASLNVDPFPERWGTLSVSTIMTWYENLQSQASLGVPRSINFIGTVGSGSPGGTARPEWSANTSFRWANGPVSASLRWRYISGVDDPAATAANQAIPNIPAYNYFFVNANWQVTDTFSLFGGIDNLTDEQPPIYTNGFSFGTDPGTYDTIGRFFYVGARVRY